MDRQPQRLIGWSLLETMVPYTRQHVLKLETAGKFPKRVIVGANRVAWVLSEVETWITSRIAERDEAANKSRMSSMSPQRRLA